MLMRYTICCVLFLALGVASSRVVFGRGAGDDALLARARAIHAKVPLIDGHNDFPWAVREHVPSLDLAAIDIRGAQPQVMTDVPRLRTGGVGGQFWSVYVPASYKGQTAVRATLEQIDIVHRMLARYPEAFEQARTADEVERIHGREDRVAHRGRGRALDRQLARHAADARGARRGYMTLTHTSNVPWADAATDTPAHGGLSPFGEAVVGEMNRLGMLVDLSHVSPDTMADALRVSQAPVIFSHSSARALSDVPRNVPDDILRQLAANGGVVMVTFVPSFIAPGGGPAFAAEWPRGRLRAGVPERSGGAEEGARRLAEGQPGTESDAARWWRTTSITSARWRASTTSASAATSTGSSRCRPGSRTSRRTPR